MSGRAGTLKYEFRVRAGRKPEDIRLAYRGATGLAVDRAGGLRVRTTAGVLEDSAPVAYQLVDGPRVPVELPLRDPPPRPRWPLRIRGRQRLPVGSRR